MIQTIKYPVGSAEWLSRGACLDIWYFKPEALITLRFRWLCCHGNIGSVAGKHVSIPNGALYVWMVNTRVVNWNTMITWFSVWCYGLATSSLAWESSAIVKIWKGWELKSIKLSLFRAWILSNVGIVDGAWKRYALSHSVPLVCCSGCD